MTKREDEGKYARIAVGACPLSMPRFLLMLALGYIRAGKGNK